MKQQNQQFTDAVVREFRIATGVLVAPEIPEKKIRNAISKNGYNGTDPIIGLIDCTVFGSAREHVMFTTTGMYWNHMTTGQLSYEDLLRTSVKSGGMFAPFSVVTGLGHTISVNGSNVPRKAFLNLLISIKNLYGTMMPRQPGSAAPAPITHQQLPQQKSKAELLAHAHNMSEARNWKAAVEAYEEAGEFRMAGLVREQEARWNKEHGL